MDTQMSKFRYIQVEREGSIFIITLCNGDENRLRIDFCQEIIRCFHAIQSILGTSSEGAVITRGNNEKFWCTGVDLTERTKYPYANSDGFYPMIHTILDSPFPTIALLTGHTFGGACPFALAHDYRVMNSERGFFCMPPVNLGLHFDGMGSLLWLKLTPQVARKMLLEAHQWTSKAAFADGIVDAIAPPGEMLGKAMEIARSCAPRAKSGVFGLLRSELYGAADRQFQAVSYVHSRSTSRDAKM